jgi:hypothetical protein
MMLRRSLAALAALSFGAGLNANTADAQTFRPGAVAAGLHFQGYDFDDAVGVDAVNLMMLPVAWSFQYGRRATVDLYTSYARGAVLIGGTEFTLSGPTDTRIRASIAATPWAVLTFGLNVPTGRTGHSAHEARVAAILGTDLLGFREANFGLGFAATTGLATAYRLGETGVGAGISYRVAGGFEPSADTAVTYTPGNELRIRVGLDRNLGSNKLTAGVTFQNFSTDRVDGQDLFQPGGRWRGDVTYSFRTGPYATWTAYATDVWRDHGDVRFAALDPATGAPTGESVRTGTQNLFMAGLAGAWRARPSLMLQPLLEARTLTRQDAGGDGWLFAVGTGVPFRAASLAFAPTGRLSYGGIEGDDGVSRRVIGGEVGVNIAFGAR